MEHPYSPTHEACPPRSLRWLIALGLVVVLGFVFLAGTWFSGSFLVQRQERRWAKGVDQRAARRVQEAKRVAALLNAQRDEAAKAKRHGDKKRGDLA